MDEATVVMDAGGGAAAAAAQSVAARDGGRGREAVSLAEFLELPSPLLRALDEDERRALFSLCEVRRYDTDDVICTLEARDPPRLFLVAGGEVMVSYRPQKGRLRPMEAHGPGGLFGAAVSNPRNPISFAAIASTASRGVVLTAAGEAAAREAVPRLASLLEVLSEVRANRGDVMAALGRLTMLSVAPRRSLGELLAQARIVTVAAGETLVAEGEPARGFFYVLEGSLCLARDRPGERPLVLHHIRERDAFGDVAFANGGVEPATVRGEAQRTRLLHVPAAAYEGLLARSKALHRSVAAAAPQSLVGRAATRRAEVVLLASALDAPLSTMTELLAQAAARTLSDRVLVVELAPRGPNDPAPMDDVVEEVARGVRGVDRLRLAVDGGAAARAALWQLLERLGDAYDLVCVDPMGRGAEVTASLGGLVTRLVNVTDDTFGPPPLGAPTAEHVLPAALLGRMRLRPNGPAFRAGTVRLALDLSRLARLGRGPSADPVEYDLLPEAEQASFARLSRAATDRRVGVALGGGGAWGYAHVALLKALLDRGIPIDAVSGASFGSIVGAYFAARGRPGLELLLERVNRTNRAIQLGMLNLVTVEWTVNKDLGGVLLEELPMPFFPASTNLGSGVQKIITRGTIGVGVRASGSFPGVFAATRHGGHRLVDGAISSNVPDEVLIPEGAQLVVASNICAEPAPLSAGREPRTRIGRALHDLSPVQRMKDLVRGTMIMLHATGDLDASQADDVFEPDPVRWMFWEAQKGREIAEQARERADAFAARIEARFRAMRGGATPAA